MAAAVRAEAGVAALKLEGRLADTIDGSDVMHQALKYLSLAANAALSGIRFGGKRRNVSSILVRGSAYWAKVRKRFRNRQRC